MVVIVVVEDADEEGDLPAGGVRPEGRGLADRLTEVYDELADIGADSAEQRASTILSAFSFWRAEELANLILLWGLAHAHLAGARAVPQATVAIARQTHQPPRPARRHLARGVPAEVEAHAGGRLARPRLPDHRLHRHSALLARKLVHYNGNYEVFEKVHRSRLEEYKKEYERQQKRLKELRKSARWARASSSKTRSSRCSARAARAATRTWRPSAASAAGTAT